MATRQRVQDIGAARARDLIAATRRDVVATRLNAGLSQDAVSIAAGLSRGRYGRIERGEDRDVSVDELARIGAALGMNLAVRLYPSGDPVRDAGHAALLSRLRARCHPSLTFRTEVPFPNPADARAWDAVISGFTPRLRCGAEAEMRPTDLQALERKLALKERDGLVDRVLLVLADTRSNRAFLRGPGEGLRVRFPVSSMVALRRLGSGLDPGGNCLIVL